MSSVPFQIGALYSRRDEIHGLVGGQRQGGISTPANQPFVVIFTGEAGRSHGYADFWESERVFHYYGEGQTGDMAYTGGNRAIREHINGGKQLLLFQMMGKGKPCRYLGEFRLLDSYWAPETPSTKGKLRNAIVFRLEPLDERSFFASESVQAPSSAEIELGSTTVLQLIEVRKKQSLFRRRLIGVEKGCRLTGVQDLRFLRASHIKPWAACATGDERTDGHNGLLLTPHADLLFDRGWITFEDSGLLARATELPREIERRLGLNLKPGRKCGGFSTQQRSYLEYHRNKIFEQRFLKIADPVEDLVLGMAAING